MLNKGLIIPSPVNPARREKMPRPMTIMPADLKKSDAYFVWANLKELKDRSISIGKVPSANMVMIKVPCAQEPLDRAAICMD